jgi:site-specific DNA-methyltransferase (cytosine-N4-specific)
MRCSLGLEPSPWAFVVHLALIFREVRRVLADDGTLWLNLGDSYAGSGGNQGHNADRVDLHVGARSRGALPKTRARAKSGAPGPKNLLGIPWQVAFALQGDGWTLRNAIIWHKPNAMPESVTDRLSTRYEHLFLFAKSRRYWFDLDAIREPLAYPDATDGSRVFGGANKAADLTTGSSARRPGNRYGAARAGQGREQGDDHDAADPRGRNPGDVWTIPTSPFAAAHFAVMPPALAERCVRAGCEPGGTVLDPFSGSGTTGLAAAKHGRRYGRHRPEPRLPRPVTADPARTVGTDRRRCRMTRLVLVVVVYVVFWVWAVRAWDRVITAGCEALG